MIPAFRKRRLSFHQKLFLIYVGTLIILMGVLNYSQYEREKNYRISLLSEQLHSYNNLIYEAILENGLCDSCLRRILNQLAIHDVRITVVDYQGNVLLDSEAKHLENHADRPEIKEALISGYGTSVRRKSATTGETFFYAATRYPQYIIRCSRPYDSILNKQLKADYHFLVVSGLLLLLAIFFIYRMTRRLGNYITQLKEFAEQAAQNKPFDKNQSFPNDELGEISRHIIELFNHITAVRDELLVQQKKLVAHFQTAHEGLAFFDEQHREIVSNPLFLQYLNQLSDTPVQQASDLFELPEFQSIPKNREPNRNQQLDQLSDEPMRETFSLKKNGRIFQVQTILFEDNSLEVILDDVTSEEETNQFKRQLTQNIAHELRTPISSIQGYMETILTHPELPAGRKQQFIERAYQQSKRLGELLRDISTLTRLDEAPHLIEKEPVAISPLIQQIITEVEREALSKHIIIQTDVDPNLVVNGNLSMLYSIFRNLLDNALAYAGENIQVVISCFKNDPDRCYFSFYDTGEGVPEQHLPHLFERFYRVDKGRTRQSGGTGLGLSIVKNAVQLHGGTITAKNRKEGGLEFIFSLKK